MRRNALFVIAAAGLCAATAMLTSAGPLNPPPGAVSPTGRTLDDIFNAIGALPDGECGADIPGLVRDDGTLQVDGSQQGQFPSILVEAFRLNVARPIDAASGLPTGQVQYKSLVVTKNIDETTPMIAQAMVQNETLQSVTLRLEDRGTDYFEIRLENAVVAGYSTGMVPRCDGTHAHLEEVEFAYQRIIWTHLPTQRTFTAQRSPL